MTFQSTGRCLARIAFALCLVVIPAAQVLAQDATGGAPRGAAVPVAAGRAQVEAALACPSCNDYDPCTLDSCDAATGTCRHEPDSCDDGNPCTVDRCVSTPFGSPCRHEPLADHTACSDGEPCTQRDECSTGVCVPGAVLNPGAACDDGNPCTSADVCDSAHHCGGVALSAGASCDDGNACTSDDRCVALGGTVHCSGTTAACADGDLCTQDLCDAATGECRHPPVDCQDGNACTSDVCDPATGQCRRDNVPGPCNDGTPCTEQDACTVGNCAGQLITCPRSGGCDHAYCDLFDGVCKHIDDQSLCPTSTSPCYGFTCTHGVCQTGYPGFPTYCSLGPGSCSQGLCVRGDCLPDVTFPCNDNNPCTNDVCAPNFACSPTAKPDGTACGTDPCSALSGTCQGGVCTGSLPVSCDDGNPCTADSCDPATGCVHAPVGCDDGNVCTADSCSTTSGGCVHAPLSNVACGADACNHYFCSNGACTEAEPNLCDDHDACTDDYCDRIVGCVHGLISCDDGNFCTADSCDANLGCVHDGPAAPAKEVCNGHDDDCDGLVDERETMPLCSVRPLIMRDAGTLNVFTVTCRFTPLCNPSGPPETIGNAWLSAADQLLSMADDVALPGPQENCGKAIVENVSRRMITDGAVTFVFDPSGNGVCGTTVGGRPGLVKALAGVPDGKLARVCVKWTQPYIGDKQRCGVVRVQRDAAEPQPLNGSPEDEGAGLLRPAP
jgi:hypothetical protein